MTDTQEDRAGHLVGPVDITVSARPPAPTSLAEAIAAAWTPPPDGPAVAAVPIGEDCDQIIAAGHLDPAAMLAVCEPVARFYYGDSLAAWLADIDKADAVPEHRYAVLRLPEADDDYGWYCEWSSAETPGAEPITVLDLS